MKADDFQHIYTLEPGDKWCLWNGHVLIVNAEKIPFMINVETGERREIKPDFSKQPPEYFHERLFYSGEVKS